MASSLEGNKIFAAILTAGIIGMGSGVASRILYHPHELEEPVIRIAATEAEGEAPAEGEAAASQPLPVLLAAADPTAGEQVAKKCASCHSFEEGGPNKVGPNLYNIVGNKIAHIEGFAYSEAMAGHGGEWTWENLDAFLKAPKDWMPGTKMSFAGLKKDSERADILAYLRTLSGSPVPLPEAPAAAADEQHAAVAPAAEPAATATEAPAATAATETPAAATAAAQPAAEATPAAAESAPAAAEATDAALAQLVAAADISAGETVARKCQACHSFEKDGANNVGPALWGVLGRPIGQHAGFKYSEAMSGHGGNWTFENLDQYLTSPKEWLPGNRMAFAGLKKPEDRAAILAYLHSLSDNPAPLTGG